MDIGISRRLEVGKRGFRVFGQEVREGGLMILKGEAREKGACSWVIVSLEGLMRESLFIAWKTLRERLSC